MNRFWMIALPVIVVILAAAVGNTNLELPPPTEVTIVSGDTAERADQCFER